MNSLPERNNDLDQIFSNLVQQDSIQPLTTVKDQMNKDIQQRLTKARHIEFYTPEQILYIDLNAPAIFEPDDFSDDIHPPKILKFVVTYPSCRILFASEGRRSNRIASHVEMCSPKNTPVESCIAAGEVYLSGEPGQVKIVSINNKSGHFMPNFNTLLWPLAILSHAYPNLIAEMLEISTLFKNDSSRKQDNINLSTQQLDEMILALRQGKPELFDQLDQAADVLKASERAYYFEDGPVTVTSNRKIGRFNFDNEPGSPVRKSHFLLWDSPIKPYPSSASSSSASSSSTSLDIL